MYLEVIMGKWKHRLLSADMVSGRGVCEHCGEVDLAIRDGRPRCSVARRQQKGAVTLEQSREYSRRARERHPDRWRTSTRKAHGLTWQEAYDFRAGKVCAICGSDEGLAVDHDHETGRVRGVLCRSCNTGLGFFGDDVARLARAIEYLTE